ncbi:keratin-associated protein 6-2-like [Episyrphus balteatus]|uniref:keratin-associated protein 6-2-like n=1 Tax=Episyrphus balteatus TaxID=286459 RepID=UPI002485F4A0|nr:keratin-associated protein 6-2-like [Episyrphus balteatus]
MFKFLALIVILVVVVSVSAFPAAEDEAKPAPNALPDKANEADLEAGEGSDLKPAETFGFGYYPSYGYGRGYGGGYGGWGYSGGYGRYSGYRRGWGGYGGYPSGYYW